MINIIAMLGFACYIVGMLSFYWRSPMNTIVTDILWIIAIAAFSAYVLSGAMGLIP